MTTDDLIPLLEQAGICQGVWFEHHKSIERLAALVAAAEREACAKVCEDTALLPDAGPLYCAAAIRARGNDIIRMAKEAGWEMPVEWQEGSK